MTRLYRPADVPRGARIIADDLIVESVSVWRARGAWGRRGPEVVAIYCVGQRLALYDPDDLLLVEERVPERETARPTLHLIRGGA